MSEVDTAVGSVITLAELKGPGDGLLEKLPA